MRANSRVDSRVNSPSWEAVHDHSPSDTQSVTYRGRMYEVHNERQGGSWYETDAESASSLQMNSSSVDYSDTDIMLHILYGTTSQLYKYDWRGLLHKNGPGSLVPSPSKLLTITAGLSKRGILEIFVLSSWIVNFMFPSLSFLLKLVEPVSTRIFTYPLDYN